VTKSDDKNHNKKILVIRTKGTIAGQYRVYSEEGANKSGLAWPSAFSHVTVESIS
jgi:hemolysin II